ncbi:hypothetical protein SARC_03169, partial [Sphaeroforma arctica JP610]
MDDMNDPLYEKQWHLHGRGQGLNVIEAWDMGFYGEDVLVSVIDDGIEYTHADLDGRYEPRASYDINDGDYDPSPVHGATFQSSHGTRCAGSIVGNAHNG